jgi:hypothetical protein
LQGAVVASIGIPYAPPQCQRVVFTLVICQPFAKLAGHLAGSYGTLGVAREYQLLEAVEGHVWQQLRLQVAMEYVNKTAALSS